jgi:alpha-galactosidase
MVQIGGFDSTLVDFEVPRKYALNFTIGDTTGPGGFFRALRTYPMLTGLCRDMQEVCPNAWLLNYSNPMSMNMQTIYRTSGVRAVGLCHSVQGTFNQLMGYIGEKPEDVAFICAGINHMAFYLTFQRRRRDGSIEDLYPLIRKVADAQREPDWNRVRYEVLRHFGYFVTESSEHFAEYTPWFIKRDRPDLIERFNIPLDEYIRRCEVQSERWREQEKALVSGAAIEVKRSSEYAARIIVAELTGEPVVVNGNVANCGYIENLPQDACVEVPCLIDHNGVQPVRVGRLPPQLAAVMQTNINVQELTVEALVTGRKDHVRHAAMLDPHTAAELSLDEIATLVDDLLAAHEAWLPQLH